MSVTFLFKFFLSGSILLALATAFWGVTEAMRKSNDQGDYSDDNQVYLKDFDIEMARDEVPSDFNAHEFL